jgi:two-component system cell cycle sensor histidine kinase PleC
MTEVAPALAWQNRTAVAETTAQRRRISQEMRAAREKLTSSNGLERVFDYELARLFAQYHASAVLPLAVLALAVGAISTFWLPHWLAGAWAVAAVSALLLLLRLSQLFLQAPGDSVAIKSWRRRFIAAAFILGTCWSVMVLALAGSPGALDGFILFVVLMVAAVSATLGATIPPAVYAGMAPLGLTMAGIAAGWRDANHALLFLMTASALVLFTVLARRIYAGTLSTLQSRAEKDAMFGELEEAKANSDDARRRAEEANLAKSRFLATMSHELRTPLNAILGFSEVMKNEVFGTHKIDAYKGYSADIHSSGHHLLDLINEILDLSRIEAGRYELHQEALQLAWIVSECRHMLGMRAKAKAQTLEELIDPSLPRIWADERAVRQIVLNILNNAVKFTPQGGEITVKVGWTSSGGQYVSIRDTGPGIPPEEIPGRDVVVRSRLPRHQDCRAGLRPGLADRQGSGRPSWRRLSAQIRAAGRDRGHRHLPGRPRHGRSAGRQGGLGRPSSALRRLTSSIRSGKAPSRRRRPSP